MIDIVAVLILVVSFGVAFAIGADMVGAALVGAVVGWGACLASAKIKRLVEYAG